MFVCVARLTLDMPESGSLKTKRQLVRRVTDRVKARFNASVSEVDEQDTTRRAVMGLAVVSHTERHATEQMERILQFIEDLYIVPVSNRELEVVAFDDLMPHGDGLSDLTIPRGERSLAEAEGLGAWEQRMAAPTAPSPTRAAKGAKAASVLKALKPTLNLEDAKAKARALRNRRDWENK